MSAAAAGVMAAISAGAAVAALGTRRPDVPAWLRRRGRGPDGAEASRAISGRGFPRGPARERRSRGGRARRLRLAAVDREVPQMLDLLAAGSSAGLSAQAALRRAAAALRGPLGSDLERLFETADMGASWREELASYAASSGSKDLRRSVAVLERTERLGSSLEEATRELAVSVRQARRAAVLARARTAPVKMLFPLVFLILPAFLLLTVVPVLLTTIRSIG